jgi:hypothetical protein
MVLHISFHLFLRQTRMSARVKIGSVESKKGLLFFITALSFGFKWSVEWKLVKATGTAQRNKANDWRETA